MDLCLSAIKQLSSVVDLNPKSELKHLKREIFISTLRVETEVWELSNGNNKVINPTLSAGHYAYGIGIYAVHFDYCRKN